MKFTAPQNDQRPRRSSRVARSASRIDSRSTDCRSFERRSATIERSLIGGLAVAAICLAIALVVNASEPNEAGWTISTPAPLESSRPSNPQMRIAINQILNEGHEPILRAPAQDRATTDAPEAADGWRSARTPVTAAEEVRGTRSFQAVGEVVEEVTDQQSAATNEIAPDDVTPEDVTPVPDFGHRFRSVAEEQPETNTPAVQQPAAKAAPVQERTAETAGPRFGTQQPAATEPAESGEAEVEANEAEAKPAKEPPAAKPAAPLPPLSQNMKNLRAKVRRVLKSYYTRPLNSRDNDPWESMHGMLAYGVHSKVRQGGPSGKTITLVGWLCYNRPLKGMTLLYTTPENELRAKQGVGLQGHMGQFLAMLAQCQVSPEYPIRVRNQEFTIQDLIAAEQETCYPKTELTFKLIALMHYLDSDAKWVNDQGQSWDIPRLIREELAQPIRGAACGGTHRLSGLSLAARTRVRRGEPLDGEYLRAAQFVEKYHNYAYQMQNRDGSLSTEWFRGRGAEDDIDRRVKTTGHILEWLCYSVNDQEIRSVRTFRAVNYLSSLLASNFDHEWEVGPQSHAIHALRLYDERVFQPYDGLEDMAKKAQRKTAQRSNSRSPNSMQNKSSNSRTSSMRSSQQR
jgi:hypothetical protein